MKYDLASMVSDKGRRAAVLIPAIDPPISLERSMLVQLRRVEHEMARAIRELILPNYKRTTLTTDADESTMDAVRLLINAMVRSVSGQVAQLIGLEGKRHTKSWMAAARRAFGIDLKGIVKEEDLEGFLDAAALRNASLIRGFADDMIKRVAVETINAVMAGTHVDTLRKSLQRQLEISDSRARLIARDQTSKLNADLTRRRHEDAGIGEYIWRTSKDERVRARHAALEGVQYKYGEPTGAEEGLPPGQPIQCRCVAQAVVRFGADRFKAEETTNSIQAPEIDPREKVLELGKDGKEHMVVMSAGRELKTFTSGDAYRIDVPSDIVRKLADPSEKLELHHNHPIDNVSFSPSDLMAFRAFAGTSEFYAHTKSTVFKIARTPKTAQISEKLIKQLTLEYDKKAAQGFVSGRATIREVENNRPHYIVQRLHARKIVNYEATGDGVEQIKEVLSRVLGTK